MLTREVEEQQSASMEDYLERIAVLAEEKGVARVASLGKALGVKNSSVTAALRKLSEKGLVNHERYGYVELTGEGRKIAADVMRRHEALGKFLTEILGVEPETAWKDACDMEHFVSPATSERLVKFVEFILSRPRGESHCLNGFDYYLEHGEYSDDDSAGCPRREQVSSPVIFLPGEIENERKDI
ncbi:MAG: metal-dependent transcriptional regulator [Dehalococcoidia bacterium]|nr:metal-dependent transcriptional regulator [Dehalococcoidia bacterium]